MRLPWFSTPRAIAGLVFAWAFLNLCLNLELRDPGWHMLLPSIDVTVLLATYALVAVARRPLPKALHWIVVPVILLAAMLRLADATQDRFFHRHFNVTLDLQLIPEGVRLMAHTLPTGQFALFSVLGIAGLALTIYLIHVSSRLAWGALRKPAGRRAFVVLLATFMLFSLRELRLQHQLEWSDAVAVFKPTLSNRVIEETDFALHAAGYKNDKLSQMAEVQQQLSRIPKNLAKLEGNNVLLVLFESYGYSSFEMPNQFKRLAPVLTESEKRLQEAGYHVVSNFMDSPTYGAGSQLAHATLATGIRITDNFQYRLVLSSDSHSISRFFNRAGYRSVMVMPGTRREWIAGQFYDFDKLYTRWDFDYAGPVIGWGELPDQYIVDFIHRQELSPAKAPTFIKYILVTSHALWSAIPPLFEDWSKIGNGEIYGRIPSKHYGLTWANMSRAWLAYTDAVAYDFNVMTSYLTQFINDDSLIIILGDHQPVVAVSGRGHPHSVPFHIISRRADFIEPFTKRGYTPGLVPRQPLPHTPMEEFLPQLLEDFSDPPATRPHG